MKWRLNYLDNFKFQLRYSFCSNLIYALNLKKINRKELVEEKQELQITIIGQIEEREMVREAEAQQKEIVQKIIYLMQVRYLKPQEIGTCHR